MIIPLSQRRKLRHTVAKLIAQCLTAGICTQDLHTGPDPSAELCPCLAPQAYVWGLRAWECNSEFTDVCSRNYRHKIYEQIY